MKKVMTMAAVALMIAGSAAFACDSCGCSAKKAEGKKADCKACDKAAKKCPADCTKACCAKKADA